MSLPSRAAHPDPSDDPSSEVPFSASGATPVPGVAASFAAADAGAAQPPTAAPHAAPSSAAKLHAWVGIAGVMMVALVLASFVAANTPLQWELHACRYAARAALAGLDPYDVGNLELVAMRPWSLPFVYPPVTLAMFLPLAGMPVAQVAVLWMGLKLALLALLVLLWKRGFMPKIEPFVFALVVAFGFDATVLWDLRTGNVAILEAALLWSGLTCWVAGRRGAFAAFVVAASLFKLTPIVFLGLLLVPTRDAPARPRLLAAALATFAALVWLPQFVGPAAAWGSFADALAGGRPQGAINPSALAMLDHLARVWFPGLESVDAGLALWSVYVAAVAAVSARWLRALWRRSDPRDLVMAVVLLYVLVHPRPMVYGYVLAIAPVLWFAPRPFTSSTGRLALAAMLAAQGLARLAHQQPAWLLLDHLSFLTVLLVWLATVLPHVAPRTATTDRAAAAA